MKSRNATTFLHNPPLVLNEREGLVLSIAKGQCGREDGEKMRRTKENLHLECILTDKEKLAYSKELSEKITAKARAEESLKSFQTQKKAEIAGCEATINLLADRINTGREFRLVECEIKYDFKEKIRTCTRTDTGEVVRETPIPEEEMQEELAT